MAGVYRTMASSRWANTFVPSLFLSLQGKRKRILTNTAIHYYKYKDFKKAVVYFKPELTNVGKGLRVPELEEGDDDMGMDYSDEEGMPKRPPQQKLPPSSAEA